MNDKKRDDAIYKIKSNPNILAIGNQLITARHDLTKSQFTLLRFLQLNIIDFKDCTKATINVLDYKKYIGAKSNTVYALVKNDLLVLFKSEISINKEKSWHKTTMISQIDYEKGIGTFTVHFPPLVSDYLLDLKNNFTYLELRFMLSLKSLYSMRLYELCKKNLIVRNFKLTIDEIKLMFGLKGYKDYNNLKTKVIKVGYDELKEKSNIYFEYEEIKKGKAVVEINFLIIDNSSKSKYLEVQPQVVNDFIIYKQQQFPITENRLESLIKEYSVSRVNDILDYLLERRDKVQKGIGEPVLNEAAYLVNMLKNKESVNINNNLSTKLEAKQIYFRKDTVKKSEKEIVETAATEKFYNNYYIDVKKLVEKKIAEKEDYIYEILTFILDDFSRLIHGKSYLLTYNNVNDKNNFIEYLNIDSTFLISVQWVFIEKFNDKDFIDLNNKSRVEAKSLNIQFYY